MTASVDGIEAMGRHRQKINSFILAQLQNSREKFKSMSETREDNI
jgi:hypothetical protein